MTLVHYYQILIELQIIVLNFFFSPSSATMESVIAAWDLILNLNDHFDMNCFLFTGGLPSTENTSMVQFR